MYLVYSFNNSNNCLYQGIKDVNSEMEIFDKTGQDRPPIIVHCSAGMVYVIYVVYVVYVVYVIYVIYMVYVVYNVYNMYCIYSVHCTVYNVHCTVYILCTVKLSYIQLVVCTMYVDYCVHS